MRMTKRPDYKKIKGNLNRSIYKALETSGNSTILALKKRIKKGVTAKGGQFKALNKKYQESKSKRGKTAMFELSGDMLRAITHQTKKTNILRFYFDDGGDFDDDGENAKAYYNIYNYKRDFFDLSEKEIKKIENRIEESLSNL